jgi:Carbohydrate binding module (family 6)
VHATSDNIATVSSTTAAAHIAKTDVDVESTSDVGGGYNVGYLLMGEWLKYSVIVNTSGSYTLQARVAAATAGGTCHVEVDGVNVTGTSNVAATGGWQVWQTITRTGIPLTAGPHLLRVVIDSNGANGYFGNLNYLRWIAE